MLSALRCEPEKTAVFCSRCQLLNGWLGKGGSGVEMVVAVVLKDADRDFEKLGKTFGG
jgi:hypothetical protein